MATLNVKNFPDDLYRALRKRARTNGRSLSSEVTMLLREQIQSPKKKYTIYDMPRLLGGVFRGTDVEEFIRKERDSW